MASLPRTRCLRPALAFLLAAAIGWPAPGSETALPAPIQASRLDALLERSGASGLGIEERRSIAQIYAGYLERFAALRDDRVDRWSAQLDDLLSLRSPPDERAVRKILGEHRSLCERAASLDRELFDNVGALVGGNGDIDRVRALRDVDRWAQTMPLHIAIGTRGDLWSMCRHLDLDEASATKVDEALRDRDVALPALVQRVWSSWRELLLAAARSFEAETGGVLPAIGAALSAEEAKALRERITQRCLAEAEDCRSARQRVRDLERRTIERVVAALPPAEAQEFLLRLVSSRGVSMTTLVINVEACYRCALAHFASPHAASAAIEASYQRWRERITQLAMKDLAARDAAQDRSILEPREFGDAFLDGSEEIYAISTAIVAETSGRLRELGSLLEGHESELAGTGLRLRRVEETSPDGATREAPSIVSIAWQRQASASFQRSPAEIAAAERSASILMARRGGIAPAMTREWIESRLPEVDDADARERRELAIAEYLDAQANEVESPLRSAVERASVIRDRALRGRSERDEAELRQAINDRDALFFVNERLDDRLFTALAEALPRAADRSPIEDARLERTVDREMHCVQLFLLSTANPWTALRAARAEQATDRTNEPAKLTLRGAMRWFLPDLRRARAAEFAAASAGDLSMVRGGIGLIGTESESLSQDSYEADRTLERSFESLLAELLESSGEARERFATSYARATMLPEATWSPSTQAIIDELGRLGMSEERMAECNERIKALRGEREALAVERARVRCGIQPARSRTEEASRIARTMDAVDDRLRTELLGLLTAAERRLLTATDSLDRLLICDDAVEANERDR